MDFDSDAWNGLIGLYEKYIKEYDRVIDVYRNVFSPEATRRLVEAEPSLRFALNLP